MKESLRVCVGVKPKVGVEGSEMYSYLQCLNRFKFYAFYNKERE